MSADNVVIVGGSAGLRGRLDEALGGSDMRILADFHDEHGCAAAAGRLEPDLVLLCDAAEKERAADTVGTLQDLFPTAQLVVLTRSGSRDLVAACLEAGASGCLPGSISSEALAHALRLILLGERMFVTASAALPAAASPPEAGTRPGDRRAAPRLRTIRRAEIVYNSGHCVVGCTILDLSEGGAKLRPADLLTLPRTFELRIAYGPVCRCETVRRSGMCVGVRFTSASGRSGGPNGPLGQGRH